MHQDSRERRNHARRRRKNSPTVATRSPSQPGAALDPLDAQSDGPNPILHSPPGWPEPAIDRSLVIWRKLEPSMSQVWKKGSQVVELPHTLAVPPPPQVLGETQEPHEVAVRARPQLSPPVTLSQSFPRRRQNSESVSGEHVPVPQTFGVPGLPPPQTFPPVHEPQEATVRDWPQLSFAVTEPQLLASRVQNSVSVSGGQ